MNDDDLYRGILRGFLSEQEDREKGELAEVTELGDWMGYGNLMEVAQKQWREKLQKKGIAGGEFAIGPCQSLVVKCGCKEPHLCDWCCGCGWLTKKVKEAKDANR